MPYAEIPGFPVSTVESHAGELHLGTLAGRPVAVMKGRVHYYEGYTMQEVAFPVRVLKAIGCHTLVITNAVGGMNPDLPPGTRRGHDRSHQPRRRQSADRRERRRARPALSGHERALLARPLMRLAERVALELGMPLPRAIFVAVPGPNLETAAEYRFLRWIGADVVGMSLVPETIVAVHGGQRVLAFNVVTDACLPDHLEPGGHPRDPESRGKNGATAHAARDRSRAPAR